MLSKLYSHSYMMDSNQSQAKTQIINLDVINKLRQDMGDETGELIGELMDMFFGDAANLLNDIKTGLQNDDRELFVRGAHTLKSSSSMLGMMDLAKQAGELESGGKSGILNSMSDLVDMLFKAYEAAIVQLREMRAQFP